MTPSGLLEYRIQLKDALTDRAIISAGGTVFVAQDGTAVKQTLYDKDGGALANPITPTRGFINFFTATTVERVDLYIMAPGGEFVVVKDVEPSGPNEIKVDTGRKQHVLHVPYSVEDQAGDATETQSAFTVPSRAMLLPNPAVHVIEADATETIDVGTMGTSNDPDGFLDGIAVSGAAGSVTPGTLTNGAATLGVLFSVQDSANSGDLVPEADVTAGAAADPISWTLTTGADTAQGFILLPYILP